jgi:N-acetylglucosamine kinase-like BadF-type ATPase
VSDKAVPAVLAIDGGSTKTDVVMVATDGSVLGRARVGPSSHQLVGLDVALETVESGVRAAARMAGLEGWPTLVAPLGVYCLAGLDMPIDEVRLTQAVAMRHWTTDVLLYNDIFAISRAGWSRPWGVVVVCGTGLNCAGVGPDGAVVRFPALAELSGDFAPGGVWLGRRALGLALRAGDGRGRPTALRTLVPDHFGLPDAESVLSQVYGGDLPEPRLAELAEVLLDAAAAGDAESRAATDVLADEVVTFAGAAITRLGLTSEPVEVVLGGGIFDTTYQGFHDRVAQGIAAVAPRALLVRLAAPPVLGAALLGLDALGVPEATKVRLSTALRAEASGPN